ncbi:MAG: response regulator [Gammaproteobacteria bacterium]|jgi:DNA-binding response OmpR family regulator
MRSAPPDSAARRRVLLVEDVDAMRLYLRLILEKQGFEVKEAADLREARSYLHAGNRPTSVLLDLELPDGHGLDILRELPVGVPVVALTGDESRETKLLCRHAGCSAVLSKSGHLGNLGRLMTNMEDHPQESSDTTALEPELARQYSTFLTQTRVELQQARERSDLETVRRLAHRLKGTAIHFGYSGISASARALGDILASGDSRRIQSTLEELIGRLTDATVHHSTH